MDKLTSVAYIYYKNYKHHTHNFVKNEINKAKSPNKVLCKQCQFLGGFDPGVQAGFDSFNTFLSMYLLVVASNIEYRRMFFGVIFILYCDT